MRSSIDLSLVANDLAPRAPQNSTLRKVCQLTLSTKSCWTGSEAVAACMATVDAARFLLSAIWLRVTVKRRPCWVNILDSVEEVDGTDAEENVQRVFSQAVSCRNGCSSCFGDSETRKLQLFFAQPLIQMGFLGFLNNFVEKSERMQTFFKFQV